MQLFYITSIKYWFEKYFFKSFNKYHRKPAVFIDKYIFIFHTICNYTILFFPSIEFYSTWKYLTEFIGPWNYMQNNNNWLINGNLNEIIDWNDNPTTYANCLNGWPAIRLHKMIWDNREFMTFRNFRTIVQVHLRAQCACHAKSIAQGPYPYSFKLTQFNPQPENFHFQ